MTKIDTRMNVSMAVAYGAGAVVGGAGLIKGVLYGLIMFLICCVWDMVVG